MTTSFVNDIHTLGESITKEVFKDSPSSSTCLQLLTTLSTTLFSQKDQDHDEDNGSLTNNNNNNNMTFVLEETLIGKTLTKALKSLKRHKRTSSPNSTHHSEWQTCIDETENIISRLKQIVSREHAEIKAQKDQQSREECARPGLPKSVAVYKQRLESQSKELYKDPPVLPPPSITIEEKYAPLPQRNEKTGELLFGCQSEDGSISNNNKNHNHNHNIKNLLKEFRPNRTPEEILRSGSFGGTYFRPIVSAVTNVRYRSSEVLETTVQPEWIKGLDPKKYLTSVNYSTSINKYKVKCGGSLGMWESSGWIADCDPYGWFQWYCRFYQGRRCSDDERQIGRWLKSAGPKGRFRSQLCNKILAAGGTRSQDVVKDASISPVIRQTLLHWGLEMTDDILSHHAKRVGKSR